MLLIAPLGLGVWCEGSHHSNCPCNGEVMLHPFYSRRNSAVGRGLKWSLPRTQGEAQSRTQHRHHVPRSSCDHKTTAAFYFFSTLKASWTEIFFFCQLRVEVNPWLALLNSISQGCEYTPLILSYFSCSGTCLILCLGGFFFSSILRI